MNRQEETERRERLRREEEDKLIQARWVVKSSGSDKEEKVSEQCFVFASKLSCNKGHLDSQRRPL